jgi:hypothetical protein
VEIRTEASGDRFAEIDSLHAKSAAVLFGRRVSANLLGVDPWDDLDGRPLKSVEGSPIPSVVCNLLKKGNIADAVRVPGF